MARKNNCEMAEETIETIDLHTEFEKLREQVIRDECCPVAKTFEHTTIYKGSIDHLHHVIYKVSYYCQVYGNWALEGL